MLTRITVVLCCMVASVALAAKPPTPETGPVVRDYGPVLAVPEGAFNLSNDRHYKVLKDVSASSSNPEEINRNLESAARFLNMQARNGTDMDQLEMAVIVHGGAAKDLLTDAAYSARFGVSNPNTALLAGLAGANVKIYVCGQTTGFRGYAPQELNPDVTLAVSAMAAHVELQTKGFTLIPF